MSQQHRILIVEDSPEVRLVLQAALRYKYAVSVASTTAEAMQLIHNQQFSLIVLDVELPDGDGFQICAQTKLLEKHRATPIIFLSGKGQLEDKVMGLSLGADDYLVKPINPLEFQARVEARIRSYELSKTSQEQLFIGCFRVLPREYKISVVNGQSETQLSLTTLEFKLLYYMITHEDQILSREQILNEVWGHLANVTDRTVDTHIYTLRQKLGHLSGVLQSIPRVGYRFSQNQTRSVA